MPSSWASSSHIDWYHSPCFAYSSQSRKHLEHTLLHYALHKDGQTKHEFCDPAVLHQITGQTVLPISEGLGVKPFKTESEVESSPVRLVFYITDKCYFSTGSGILPFEVVSFSSEYQESYWIGKKEAKFSILRDYIAQF